MNAILLLNSFSGYAKGLREKHVNQKVMEIVCQMRPAVNLTIWILLNIRKMRIFTALCERLGKCEDTVFRDSQRFRNLDL